MKRQELSTITLRERKVRHIISRAKMPLLSAVREIIEVNRSYWPLSVRQIHYRLLNLVPLCHASKPDSAYSNTPQDYRNQCIDICGRGRLIGLIPWEAIADETRPTDLPFNYANAKDFVRTEFDHLLSGYSRDLSQSQPDYVEIVVEKNTAYGILRPIAHEFHWPISSGRGYSSLSLRHDMAQRFRASGRRRLVMLLLSDFDPDGQEISHSFARSMRDDFDVDGAVAIQVAVTANQVQQLRLPPIMTAKQTSTKYNRFIQIHGTDIVHELEAIDPATLSGIVRTAVLEIMDQAAFENEKSSEESDHDWISRKRMMLEELLPDFLDDEEEV